MDNEKPEDNFMKTQTISLFDKNIDSATLYGLQYHFHAPSEHSINGKLLDLEMHIVHALDPKHVNPEDEKDKSQFTNGVLGFIFSAVPDDFEFELHGLTDYHDKFLETMLDAEKKGKKDEKIDLTKFVKLLNFNRRWSYNGSLTTAPFSEGILWNVLEQVIPIRQSTLEKFLDYRKVDAEKTFNNFEDEADKKNTFSKLALQPENVKPFENAKSETFFRVAACNRVVQDQGDRPVYHIDIEE
jgi:carbonic anhydrase